MKNLKFLMLPFLMVFLFASCQDDLFLEKQSETSYSFDTKSEGPDPIIDFCGDKTECILWGGQTIETGTLTVVNNENQVSITYETSGEWQIQELHLWYGTDINDVPKNRPGNLVIGHFPYSETFDPFVTTHTFIFDLDGLGDKIFVVAHAVVVILDDDGEIIAEETAFGGCIEGDSGNRWWFYTAHTVQECIEFQDPDFIGGCFEWVEETAWGGNSNGGGSAWWFYFDGDGQQGIYAGQELVEGAFVELIDGSIHITLGDNLRLQDDDESVKILGYNELPNSRPVAGAANPNQIYAGTSLIVEVEEFDYYAIHLDAEVLTEVECPEEE